VREALDTGDYAIRVDGVLAPVRIERKGLGEIFTSFCGDNYRREREKIARAKDLKLKYLIAIEGTISDVRKGHRYYKQDTWHESQRDPLSLIRMLMTISQKHNVEIHYCNGKDEMGFFVQEYLMTHTRGVLDGTT